MSLKAASNTSSPFETWDAGVTACTLSATNGTCVPCGTSDCWKANELGQLQCMWKYVTCRDWRVVKVDLSHQSLQLAYLPPGLANGTLLEALLLEGIQVNSGSLPSEYASWTYLTTLR
jgi:hypothetical protein